MNEASCSHVGLGVEAGGQEGFGGPVRDEYLVEKMYLVRDDRHLHSRQ